MLASNSVLDLWGRPPTVMGCGALARVLNSCFERGAGMAKDKTCFTSLLAKMINLYIKPRSRSRTYRTVPTVSLCSFFCREDVDSPKHRCARFCLQTSFPLQTCNAAFWIE